MPASSASRPAPSSSATWSRSAGAAASTATSRCTACRAIPPIRISPTTRRTGSSRCCTRSPRRRSTRAPRISSLDPRDLHHRCRQSRPPTSSRAAARAVFNVRFNDRLVERDGRELAARRSSTRSAGATSSQIKVSGESFLVPPGAVSDILGARDRARASGASRCSAPPAARRTRASSTASARWPSSAWSTSPCTRWTSMCRSPTSPRSTAIYRTVLDLYFPPERRR